MPKYNTEYIKQKNPILTVIGRYGLIPDKKGFICCPFHAEKTASFKIYTDTNSYYCFGCGESGDVIDFVRRFENVSFDRACELLGGDTMKFSEFRQVARHIRRQGEEQKRRERVIARYWTDFDRLKLAEDTVKQLRPNAPEETPDPRWLASLNQLSGLQYALEQSESEVMKNGL